jgi:hypothetical protein
MDKNNGGESMTEYYWGMLFGGLIGYCLALFTMITIWSLCVVAKQSDEGRDYAEKDDGETEQRTTYPKRVGRAN